jgi:hypothetical protein
MPQLQALVSAEKIQDVIPGEFLLEVVVANPGKAPARLNMHQASHPALVLDLRDGKDEPVLLPAPSAPDEFDLAPGEEIAPGEERVLTYAGFLDRSLPPGNYRVRYFGQFLALGGSVDDPLSSDWLAFTVRPTRGFVPGKRIPGLRTFAPGEPQDRTLSAKIAGRGGTPYITWLRDWLWWLRCQFWWPIICCLRRSMFGLNCDRLPGQEFDELRTETISNAPAGAEAWNGTYSWRTRFLLTADESSCGVTATIRVRLVGAITAAQQAAWESAIESAWNNRFKVCSNGWCCCRAGAVITADIQFVTSGEHQVVNVGPTTTNMSHWGVGDIVDVSHEFGHMLGALDEYFTVNGTDWGAGRQATGAVMNNPANPPVARHYETVRAAATTVLGRSLNTVGSTVPCGC